MSNQPKGGMEFFKKFADKGGSLFGGMKIKGPKQTKNVAQTQTNFSYNEKSSEDVTSTSITRDDTSLKQEYKEVERGTQVENKGEDLNIKKTKSKNSQTIQTSKRGQNTEVEAKKIETSIKEVKDTKQVTKEVKETKQVTKEVKEPPKQIRQEIKVQVIQNKPTQIIQKTVVVQQKKSLPIAQRKKSQKIPAKRSDNESTVRKPVSQIKQQKKLQQKPKKSDRQQVLDQINEYNLKLAQSVITQKNIQAKICQFREQISELRQKTSHWASQQSLCVEREEYQEADKLQTKIEEAQNKIDELTIEMNLSEDQLLKQENEELNILKNQNGSIKKVGRKLKLIELQLQDDAAVIKREQIQKIQNLKSKQEAERKKIQRVQKDITYQNQQISELQKIFKIELDSKLDPLFQEKGSLQSNKAELQSEIKELQKKLREKKAQLGETNKQLKSVNENIAQINQSFRQESTKLQQRKNKLQIIENEHQQMKSQMNYIQKQIEDQSKSTEEKIEKKLGEALQMASLAKSIDLKQTRFDDQIQLRRVAYDNYIQNGKILKEYEQSHRQQKQKIKEISYKRVSISAQISKLQQKRDSIRKKLPNVQAQQKKFAEQKNFKAAGLKKTEIKQMNDELARIKQKIQGCVIEQHALTMEEQQLHQAQKNNIDEEEELRKNLASSQYHYAQIKLQKIQEYKESLSKHGQFKQRQRVLKELTEVIDKITEQISYLRGEYNLSEKKQVNQEEENIVEDNIDSENDIQQQKQEEVNKMDNNQQNQQYSPPVFHEQLEQQRMEIDQQQESGYVPLSLD